MARPAMKARAQCGVPGCPHEHASKGLCKRHYDFRKNNPDRPLLPFASGPRVRCPVEWCDREVSWNGHCARHARQLKTHGKILPENHAGNHGSKLSRAQARKIVADKRSLRAIAADYGVSHELIRKTKNRGKNGNRG